MLVKLVQFILDTTIPRSRFYVDLQFVIILHSLIKADIKYSYAWVFIEA